jgi:hypothetical protein
MEAWCSDAFSAMIGEGKKHQKLLLEFVTAFLEKWQHDEGLLPEGPLAELHEETLKVVSHIVSLARCIVALANPTPGFFGSSSKDVTCWTQPNPSSDDVTSLTIRTQLMTCPHWIHLTDDYLKTFSSSRIVQPVYEKLCADFKAHELPVFEVLGEAIGCYDKIKAGFRAGGARELDRLMLDRMRQQCDQLLLSTSSGPWGSHECNILLKGLQKFVEQDGVLDLQKRVGVWMAAMAADIHQKDVGRIITDFTGVGGGGKIDVQTMHDALKKLAKSSLTGLTDAAVTKGLRDMIPNIVAQVHDQAQTAKCIMNNKMLLTMITNDSDAYHQDHTHHETIQT